jgi:hypothetical protein
MKIAIASLPLMIQALKSTRSFLGNCGEISKVSLKVLVGNALSRIKN